MIQERLRPPAERMRTTIKLLAVNPGSTSTKISVFDGCEEIFSTNIEHDWQLLKNYSLFDQLPLREENIAAFLEKKGIDIKQFDAVVGRCGDLIKPVKCGTYKVTDEMLEDVRRATRGHASSLGICLADVFAKKAGVSAYAVNPTSVIEAWPLAMISGLKNFPKDNHFHVLSHKEVGIRAGQKLGRRYEDLNLIIAHLGGGITIAAHHKGLAVDSTSAVKSTGPFSGRRAGGIRTFDIVNLCFSEGMTKEKMEDILMKTGGLVDYLGTDDGREIEARINNGDEYAKLIYEAMAYRISKEIGMYATVLKGEVDAICLTGGMANSEMLVDWITERTGFIAPIFNFPGTLEMEAMNNGVQRILSGEVAINVY